MSEPQNEAFSRVLINQALEFSGWNLLDPRQARLELHTATGRADYVLGGQRGPLAGLEAKPEDADPVHDGDGRTETPEPGPPEPKDIPVWEGEDVLVSQKIRIVGPDGEKVDIMTFRGSYERDIKEFVTKTPELQEAIEAEDDDTVETIVNERFYHRPEMYYSPDKLVISYGVPAPTPAFVYNAVGKKPLPPAAIVADTVDSIAARFNLRYNEQKWLDTTAQLLAEDSTALRRFISGDMTLFTATQFNQLGGITALTQFGERDHVFEALRQSTLVRQSLLAV